jgi:adenosyl cobinamide kinase/adenosyl cobinamide phosphate guanylyltransferase
VTLVLLTGGARSGKSRFALELARAQSAEVVFLATAEPRDAEMAARIGAHRDERPEAWRTVEEPLALRAAIADVPDAACLVVDCLTLWVSNALSAWGAAETEAHAREAAAAAAKRSGLTAVVTNEIGLGIVPASPLGRDYRDLLGAVNAIWAREADEALFFSAGRALRLLDSADLLEDFT